MNTVMPQNAGLKRQEGARLGRGDRRRCVSSPSGAIAVRASRRRRERVPTLMRRSCMRSASSTDKAEAGDRLHGALAACRPAHPRPAAAGRPRRSSSSRLTGRPTPPPSGASASGKAQAGRRHRRRGSNASLRRIEGEAGGRQARIGNIGSIRKETAEIRGRTAAQRLTDPPAGLPHAILGAALWHRLADEGRAAATSDRTGARKAIRE